jgi:hypothetical protein
MREGEMYREREWEGEKIEEGFFGERNCGWESWRITGFPWSLKNCT